MQKFLSSLGTVASVIGAQWGDEGKGKVTDLLGEHFDVIARACGGANAGHTVIVEGEKHVFHLLPSGVLHQGKPIVLGAGMAIHLPTLLEEIDQLQDVYPELIQHIYLSGSAHILLDVHKQIDAHLEELRAADGSGKIGTTKRGIGPAYTDKAARSGLRIELLLQSDAEIDRALQEQCDRAQRLYGIEPNNDAEMAHIRQAKERLQSCICQNVPKLLDGYICDGKKIVIEGAQATMLDLDHGTYPYVTSSSTTLAGALQGLGLRPNAHTASIGVAKAYCTRVGEGDFATEVHGEAADRLRERGGEYGATTGRPRRCGWLHIPDLQYSQMINGFAHWNLTKLDVLDEEESIPVGIHTDSSGAVVYQELPGWQESTKGVTEFANLPKNAQDFCTFIEEQTGTPVSLIGTGQGREEMIIRS